MKAREVKVGVLLLPKTQAGAFPPSSLPLLTGPATRRSYPKPKYFLICISSAGHGQENRSVPGLCNIYFSRLLEFGACL